VEDEGLEAMQRRRWRLKIEWQQGGTKLSKLSKLPEVRLPQVLAAEMLIQHALDLLAR
jgi:hypothetical protein